MQQPLPELVLFQYSLLKQVLHIIARAMVLDGVSSTGKKTCWAGRSQPRKYSSEEGNGGTSSWFSAPEVRPACPRRWVACPSLNSL